MVNKMVILLIILCLYLPYILWYIMCWNLSKLSLFVGFPRRLCNNLYSNVKWVAAYFFIDRDLNL